MAKRALVIAAHGSRDHPSSIHQVQALAREIQAMSAFEQVSPAFHLGHPGFADVLDTLAADHTTVVPLMTSEGYFSQVVLPRELQRNEVYATERVRITAPVGTHPGVIESVDRRVRDLQQQFHFSDDSASIAVIGHGTPRNNKSRNATEDLANALRELHPQSQVLTGYLDDQPRVESLLERATGATLLAIPFLIGGGIHAVKDVPESLGLVCSSNTNPPYQDDVDQRQVICDRAFGSDPAILKMVLDLAQSVGSLP